MPDFKANRALVVAAGAGLALLPAGPGAPTAVVCSATANVYGSYVEMRSASGNAIYITGIEWETTVPDAQTYQQYVIGVGGAGSEVPAGECGVAYIYSAAAKWGFIEIFPWIPVVASARIAIKVATDVGWAGTYSVKLHTIDQANVVAG